VRARPELCVGALVERDGALLLVERAQDPGKGTWSVPGGRVEGGERMEVAVVRELAEETGLHGVCEDLVGWVERISDEYHFVIADFVVTVEGVAEPVAGDDAAAARFVPLNRVHELPLARGLLDFLLEHGYLSR
jgi:8-oxo-dGTP diphosphatase